MSSKAVIFAGLRILGLVLVHFCGVALAAPPAPPGRGADRFEKSAFEYLENSQGAAPGSNGNCPESGQSFAGQAPQNPKSPTPPGVCLHPSQIQLMLSATNMLSRSKPVLLKMYCANRGAHPVRDSLLGLYDKVEGTNYRPTIKKLEAGMNQLANQQSDGLSLGGLQAMMADASKVADWYSHSAVRHFGSKDDDAAVAAMQRDLPGAQAAVEQTVRTAAQLPLDPKKPYDPNRWDPYIRQNMGISIHPDCATGQIYFKTKIPATPLSGNQPTSIGPIPL